MAASLLELTTPVQVVFSRKRGWRFLEYVHADDEEEEQGAYISVRFEPCSRDGQLGVRDCDGDVPVMATAVLKGCLFKRAGSPLTLGLPSCAGQQSSGASPDVRGLARPGQ